MNMIRSGLFRDSDENFDRFLTSMFRRRARDGETTEWTPSADISETDNEYLIRADLPAVPREDIKVNIDQGMITISGERKHESETKKKRFHRIESFYGSFSRSFGLPDNVDQASIKADCKDGVLTVHLPKTAKPSAKTIDVQVH
jgi:HSP20 family protein